MRRNDRRMDGPIRREQLEFLASISPEWRDEQCRRDRAAAEEVHQRELDDFVRAITVPDWSKRGLSPARSLNQDFIEAVTRPAWLNDECPVTSEDVANFVEAITNGTGSSILERDWNPARHPRVPKGQPGGGQWTSAGGVGSGGGTSGSTDSASNAPTASLAAWHPPVGHHWVTVGAIQDAEIRPFLSREAVEYAAGAYSGPTNPPHGNQKLNGVTHPEYSAKVKGELKEYIKTKGITPGKQMTGEQMQEFESLMKRGVDVHGNHLPEISSYNEGIKKILPKNAPTKSTAIDDVIAAGKKYMKQGRFRMIAAGAVVSGVLGEAVVAQAKILEVATDSGYYKRAVRELQNGNLDKARTLLIGDDQSLYAEIQGKVGVHAAINYKRAMEKVFDDALMRDYK